MKLAEDIRLCTQVRVAVTTPKAAQAQTGRPACEKRRGQRRPCEEHDSGPKAKERDLAPTTRRRAAVRLRPFFSLLNGPPRAVPSRPNMVPGCQPASWHAGTCFSTSARPLVGETRQASAQHPETCRSFLRQPVCPAPAILPLSRGTEPSHGDSGRRAVTISISGTSTVL